MYSIINHYIDEVMDVRNLTYEDNFFDLIIDKSTIDALLCGEKSFVNVAKMLMETQRTLKESGVYFMISYGNPESRMFHLEREHLSFDINIYTIKKDYMVDGQFCPGKQYEKLHYVYICKKKHISDNKEKFEKVLSELEEDEKMEIDYYTHNSHISNFQSLKCGNEFDDGIFDDNIADSDIEENINEC
jgi:ubiquinone/menaquinone biosynthesis C-methylase UbiE